MQSSCLLIGSGNEDISWTHSSLNTCWPSPSAAEHSKAAEGVNAPLQAMFSPTILSPSNESGSSSERRSLRRPSHLLLLPLIPSLVLNCLLDKTEAWAIAAFTVNDFAHTNSRMSCIVYVLRRCLVCLCAIFYCQCPRRPIQRFIFSPPFHFRLLSVSTSSARPGAFQHLSGVF